ncbi:hypothetical protein LFL96_31245 [Paraburkholderia sp. D15]|uniref:hypothetical protein n=1 Tax=Paraburkholderia sp. D15 TaxID=2880218 RepID=UPI00247A919C|nr:hypothetical protein [Paraburkholderia sp. D15]WGS52662.1 hypothetical protein LFL96_31245 [Paraburkholderia sp. D15]
MTIENDFLPFATGGGANVLPQSAYAALPAVSTGYQSGVAQSAALNKTWRQSSIMAAVVAQFINAQTGQPAIDDGTTATLLANLTSAVNAASKNKIVLSDTGAVNAYAAANPVPMNALPTVTGVTQTVQIAHANTGASTYAPDGLAAKPVFGLGGSVLQGGELPLNGLATLVSYVGPLLNGGNLCWVLYECVGGAQQVAPAIAGQHAVQLQQAQAMRGTYNGTYAYNTSQTLTTAQIGAVVDFYGASAGTLYIPQGSTVPQGGSFYFVNVGTAILTIALYAGDQALPGGSISTTTIALQPGDDLAITRSVLTTQWLANGSCVRQFNPLVVNAATSGTHAAQMQQMIGVVGSVRNLKASLAGANTSITFTADEIGVKSALGGPAQMLANFNQTVSTTTTGIGGVVGAALTANGYAGIYAAYNVWTGAQGIFVVNANAFVPYVAASPPAGWVSTGLISVWPLNGSAQFKTGVQFDRDLVFPIVVAYITSAVVSPLSGISVATIIPANARAIVGEISASSTTSSNFAAGVTTDAYGSGQQNITQTGVAGACNYNLKIGLTQAIYFSSSNSAGTPTFTVYITGYSI